MKYPPHIQTPSQRKLYGDFRVFLWLLWKALRLPAPTPVQLDIAHYIATGPRRRIIQAFRGVGKSFITAAYVLWRLYRDPQVKILVVSASKERADAFSIFVKRLIEEVPELGFLRPKDGQRNSNIAFDVGPAEPDQSPSVKSIGITGQITGSRADLIVPDDVEVPGNSATEAQREKLSELVKEFDAVLKPKGDVCVLGTPQTQQSLYALLRKRGYDCRVWTSKFCTGLDEKGVDKYSGALAEWITNAVRDNPGLIGHTVEPSRFTDIDLAEREASYGKSGFALQFMLDTAMSDAFRFPLKIRDFICMDVNRDKAPVGVVWASGNQQVIEGLPNVGFNGDRYHAPMHTSTDFAEYDGKVMFIDPAGRGKDETAYAIVYSLRGMLYLAAWGGLQGGYDESVLQTLAVLAKDHKVRYMAVEANFGDGMFTALFKPILAKVYPCTLEEFKVTGQKETRIIDCLEPLLNQHRLVIDKRLVEVDGEMNPVTYSGLYQLSHLTRDRGSLKNDDRIDILAEACRYYLLQVQNDITASERLHKDRLLNVELEKHMRACKVPPWQLRQGRSYANLTGRRDSRKPRRFN